MSEYTLKDLFEEYVFQREHRVSSQQAMRLLREMAPELIATEGSRLARAIQKWEVEHPDIDAELPSAVPPPPEAPRSTIKIQRELVCPHCGKHNPQEAKYCYSCGMLVSQSGATAALVDDIEDASVFGHMATLSLIVRGYEQNPLRVQVQDETLIIGRNPAGSPPQADVDLQSYGAEDNGVSRKHATLERQNQTLTLIDNGSVNHTYLNGERVHPHEKRVLRDGDELRFGKLVVRVIFQQELRRLG